MQLKSPRTPHLVGSGIPNSGDPSERLRWEDICGRFVVMEEKIDGSEVSFHFDTDARLIARERSTEIDLASRGGSERHLDSFKAWLDRYADEFFDRIEDRYVVYAEWCAVAHCILYDRLPDYFIECDIQDKKTGDFLSTARRRQLLEGLEVAQAPVLFEGVASKETSPGSLVKRSLYCSEGPVSAVMSRPTRRGADFSRLDMGGIAEGVYGKLEEDGKVVGRFKWIREDFVRRIVDGGRHWKNQAPVPNQLAPDQKPSSFATSTSSALPGVTRISCSGQPSG
jgi:hypothetical protein